MWIFTRTAFASVVEDALDPSRLVVRARIAGDLAALRDYVPDLSAAISTPARDYPYRAFCSRQGMAAGLAKVAMEIDYPNFKSEVLRVQGLPRERLYSQVWQVMQDAEASLGTRDGAPGRSSGPAPKRARRKTTPARRAGR